MRFAMDGDLEQLVNAFNNGWFQPPVGSLEVTVKPGSVSHRQVYLKPDEIVCLVSHSGAKDMCLIFAHSRRWPVMGWIAASALEIELIYRFDVVMRPRELNSPGVGLNVKVVQPHPSTAHVVNVDVLMVKSIRPDGPAKAYNDLQTQTDATSRSQVMLGDLIIKVDNVHNMSNNNILAMRSRINEWDGRKPLCFTIARNVQTQIELANLPLPSRNLQGLLRSRAENLRHGARMPAPPPKLLRHGARMPVPPPLELH